MRELRCSIIIPAKDEGAGIISTLMRISEAMDLNYEVAVVVDSKSDSTSKFVREFAKKHPNFKCFVNQEGQGPASAIKWGLLKTSGDVVVITMADGSDDPKVIPDLVSLVERGVAVAAASRYMSGGQQIGAPFLKGLLSRLAGKSLYHLRRIGTHDPTNSFKAYDRKFLNSVTIESQFGFEMALELVSKAKRFNYPVAELPTIWIERNFGKSKFKLFKWLPRYLHWYIYALKFNFLNKDKYAKK
jgi:dolichol-phosphate mannosyltransferase